MFSILYRGHHLSHRLRQTLQVDQRVQILHLDRSEHVDQFVRFLKIQICRTCIADILLEKICEKNKYVTFLLLLNDKLIKSKREIIPYRVERNNHWRNNNFKYRDNSLNLWNFSTGRIIRLKRREGRYLVRNHL